jgi:hypothetical protein
MTGYWRRTALCLVAVAALSAAAASMRIAWRWAPAARMGSLSAADASDARRPVAAPRGGSLWHRPLSISTAS